MTLGVVFKLATDLAIARGARAIKDLPGCYEMEFGDGWRLAFNGHGDSTKESTGLDVPAYALYVEWRGTPAGILYPNAGTMLAGGAEDKLISALEAALSGEMS